MQGILPDDVRASFERDGFYVFKGLVDASVLTVRPAPLYDLLLLLLLFCTCKRADDGRNLGL